MTNRAPKKLNSDLLWTYALRTLTGRAMSSGEMQARLRQRAADPEDIPGVLSRLKEYGFLNDKRFAEGFASARLENDGFGKARVMQDLRARRVAPAVAEGAVGQVYAESDEERLIEAFIRRKFKSVEGFQNEKDLASAYRRLRRAGFGSSQSIKVLKRFARNPELLDAIEEPLDGAVPE